MNQLPNSRVIWHERCLKDSEFESASKQMNTSQKRIPIFEFGEVKLEPAILRSKTSLKPTTRQRDGHRADIIKRHVFAREWKFLRAGSERVSSFGSLGPILPATPATFAEEQRKTPVCEFEMESRK